MRSSAREIKYDCSGALGCSNMATNTCRKCKKVRSTNNHILNAFVVVLVQDFDEQFIYHRTIIYREYINIAVPATSIQSMHVMAWKSLVVLLLLRLFWRMQLRQQQLFTTNFRISHQLLKTMKIFSRLKKITRGAPTSPEN